MTDSVSQKRRSEIMSNIRSKGMKPEMIVRRLVHSMGYRYRLHQKDLPGRPDLVFRRRRKAIAVHGCFWHQHTDPACKIVRIPYSNSDYWIPKLARNMQRDREQQSALKALGWDVLVIWECETKNADGVIKTIGDFMSL